MSSRGDIYGINIINKEPFKSTYSYEKGSPSRTSVYDDVNDGAIDYCDQFKAYLRKGRLSDRLVKKFIDLIVTVVDYNIQLLVDVRHRTVFQIADTELLANYYSILMKDDVFATQNVANARIPEAALLDYIEFAKTIPLNNHTPRTEKAKEEDPIPPQGAPVPDDILVEANLAPQN